MALLSLMVEVGGRLSLILHSFALLSILVIKVNARLLPIDVEQWLPLTLLDIARLLRHKVAVDRIVARPHVVHRLLQPLESLLFSRFVVVELFVCKVEV